MKRTTIWMSIGVAVSLLASNLVGQCGQPILPQNHPTVSVDLASGSFSQKLPFDESFIMKVPIPERTDSIHFRYGAATLNANGNYEFIAPMNRPGSVVPDPFFASKEINIDIRPLEPNVQYLFRFTIFKTVIDSTANPPIRRVTHGSRDVIAKTETALSNHFQTDFGVMRSQEAGYWGVVSNAHFYFLPVNKNADPCSPQSALEFFAKRISIFAGLSVLEIESNEDVEHLFGIGTPTVGIGVRDIPYLGPVRINTGVVWFEQDDANPLVPRRIRKRDVFVSVTSDVELKGLLGPLFSIIK